MKSPAWSRVEAIRRLRKDVWKVLSQAARTDDDVELAAAALLQMTASDVRALAQIQFVLSEPVGRLLENMPTLLRRLNTTTVHETETAADRVRGPIRWGETFAARAGSGIPHLYVTAPARRALRTPENELLVFALRAVVDAGRKTGWHTSTSETAGRRVRERVGDALRWLQARSLLDIPLVAPTPRRLSRVRSGRSSRRYRDVIETCDLHQSLLARLDREILRKAIEEHALVVAQDPTLLEIECLFKITRALAELGWAPPAPRLVAGGLVFQSRKADEHLRLYYQHTPKSLSIGSVYRNVQAAHAFHVGGLIPDLVLRCSGAGGTRWILFEVKGVKRRVEESARAAAMDLLAYRRAFNAALEGQAGPYGVGIAWGAELEPAPGQEILLCSPDTVGRALECLGL